MKSGTIHTMKRALSMTLVFVLILTFVPFGLLARAAVSNSSVDNALIANGYTPGSSIASIDLSGDPTVIGTLNLSELKADYPSLAIINVRNTNITNVIDSNTNITVLSSGTFASGDRQLMPSSSTVSYNRATASGAGINVDTLAAALQPNVSDGTTAASLLSSTSVASCLIDSIPVSIAGGIISDADLQLLSIGTHTLLLELNFKNVTGSWTYTVTYTLNITDVTLTLTPSSTSVSQGGTVSLTLSKLDEHGAPASVGTVGVPGANLTVTDTFTGAATVVDSNVVGNNLMITVDVDPTETPASYTVSVTDSTSNKTVTATINVTLLAPIGTIELEEWNNGTSGGVFAPPDIMYIKGGTSISTKDLSNFTLSLYSSSTIYLLSDGTNPLDAAYCSVLTATDTAGNVIGEFVPYYDSVSGTYQAALRVVANPIGTFAIQGLLTIASPWSTNLFTINYSISRAAPVEYVLYQVDGSVPLSTDVQGLIDSGSTDVEEFAVYRDNGPLGWNPVSGSTAQLVEQNDAWIVAAARYEAGGATFVLPYIPVEEWFAVPLGGGQNLFTGGFSTSFPNASNVLGQTGSVNFGATLALLVMPQLNSGGETVKAGVQVNDGVAPNTLYFDIYVAPRTVVGYEFRSSTGTTLVPADTLVPIGASKSFRIYVLYSNGVSEQVNFSSNQLTVSYSDTSLFPAASNPGMLDTGSTMTATATRNGGANDAVAGQTSTVTVTDSSGKTGSVVLTMGNSLITGLTYYAETPDGILEYGSGNTLKEIYSASTLPGGVLDIPRGLNVKVWIVPTFTNDQMYVANTATGDWRDFGVTTGAFSSLAATGGSLSSPSVSGNAIVLDTAGAVEIDINDPITASVTVGSSVMVNGNLHELAAGSVSTNMTVKIAAPVVVSMDVEQWVPSANNYVSIYNAGTSEYSLNGNVGDEFKLRVTVKYSDGSSVDAIGNNTALTYTDGVLFLPDTDVDAYDPAAGYTSIPTSLSFGTGSTVTGLGVVHGYFMSRSPKTTSPSSYFSLVNPSGGGIPSQTDWNNGNDEHGIQNILAGLTRQIQINQKSGTAGGVTAGYISKSGDIIPGHFSVKLNKSGDYELDFNGLFSGNGMSNKKTEIGGISSGIPLVINVYSAPPTIEKVYLVGDGVSLVSAASASANYDLYSFDTTTGNNTFKVYPILLDSSYFLTSDYIASGMLPTYLASSNVASLQGINRMKNLDWTSVGICVPSIPGILYISQQAESNGDIYFEVTFVGVGSVPQTSPITIDLVLALTATTLGSAKYNLSPLPANPTTIAVYTTTNPIVQDIVVGGGYTASGSATGVEIGDSISFPVQYMEGGSGVRNLSANEYPGSPGSTNVLVVAPSASNPAPCAFAFDPISGDLKFSPTVVGTYTFELSTLNVSGVIIPTPSQGKRIITFAADPTSISTVIYYGESTSIASLVSAGTSYAETATPTQLDAANLAAGRLRMASNTDGTTTVTVKNASGIVIATIQVTLTACTTNTTLEPAALKNSAPGSWFTFADGQSVQMHWKTEYTRPGTSTVTYVEHSNPMSITSIGPDNFLTLTGSTLTATAPSGTGPWYGIYTVSGSGGATDTIYVMLDNTLPQPIYTYELRDSNTGTYNVLTTITLQAGQSTPVYLFDTTGTPVQATNFTVSSNAASIASVTNVGTYAQVDALTAGTATITFYPFQGAAETLSVTVTQPVQTIWDISGTVKDSGTLAGIPGVTLALLDSANVQIDTTTTDTLGNYSFAGVTDGSYTVEVLAATGYTLPGSASVTVNGANVTANDIDLTPVATPPGTYIVSGMVTDASSAAIPGATVELIDATLAIIGTSTTDSFGQYAFIGVADGTYTVQAAAATYITDSITITVNGTNYTTADIQLLATHPAAVYDVSGVVTNLSSAAIPGATVDLIDATLAVIDTTTTDAAGQYIFSGVADGTYTVQASMTGYITDSITITVNGSNYTTADIQLSAVPPVGAYDVSGTVTDTSSAAIAGASVYLIDTTLAVIDMTTTDAAGLYAFTNVADGAYTVQASAAGYVTDSITITVSGTNYQNADIQLAAATPSSPTASITLTHASITVGGSTTGIVTVTNFSGTLTYAWASSDPSVATVTNTGTGLETITGVSVGTATISCTVSDGTTTITATALITVTGGGSSIPLPPVSQGSTNTYTLTFNTNGGSAVASINSNAGTVISLTQTTTREGYTFTGWYLDQGLTDKVTSVTLESNLTVYAGWEADEDANSDANKHFAYISARSNGLFEPDAEMTRAEVAISFARMLQGKGEFTGTYTNTFTDVPSDAWYADAIGYIQQAGLINGYEDGSFRPDNKITRAEIAAIISRFADVSSVGGTIYNDVSADHWAYEYIKAISANGWTNGYPDGSFKPNNNITRAEVVTIINRMLERHADEAYIDSNLDLLITFSDVHEDHWAYYDIVEASNDHMIMIDGPTEVWTD